jgi:hypothetical protein
MSLLSLSLPMCAAVTAAANVCGRHCCCLIAVTAAVGACRHVQLMMLRRKLASLGVELTHEEAAILTTAVSDTLILIMGSCCDQAVPAVHMLAARMLLCGAALSGFRAQNWSCA